MFGRGFRQILSSAFKNTSFPSAKLMTASALSFAGGAFVTHFAYQKKHSNLVVQSALNLKPEQAASILAKEIATLKKTKLELKEMKVLLTKQQIDDIIKTMAKEISKKFNNTDEKPLLLLTMLNGASYFASDLKAELCNRYGLLFKEDAIRLSRYGDSHQGGKVTIERLPTYEQLVGKQVLIIEDLIEAGVTLHATIEALKERGVQENDIYVAVFTNKINARQKGYEVKLDFVGYPMEEDEWLVGYGCDQAGYARAEENLKYLPKEAQRRLGYSS